MIETISFIILIGLITYTQLRKILFKGEKMKCFACGRRVIEKPVEAIVDGKKVYFCCEHCATTYLQQSKKRKIILVLCGCTVVQVKLIIYIFYTNQIYYGRPN